MPKGRIGLSLEPETLKILNEHGRSEIIHNKAAKADARPTRGEIVDVAVAQWAARQGKPAKSKKPTRK